MEAASSDKEIVDKNYNGMVISVTKDLKSGKHEYEAHWDTSFDDEPIDLRYPVNVSGFHSRREIEAWIDGYQQGASDNR